ncbi:MAG: glycosyltransferase family 2 protein [Caldilinea sp.]
MKTTVIVPVWNGRRYLESCFTALLAQRTWAGEAPELIAVDNASTDGGADFIAARFPTVRLLRNRTNQGFAGGCNRGLEAANGELLILLNQDTQVQPGWLNALHAAAADPTAGAIGCKILYPDARTIQHAGATLEWPLGLAHHIGAGELDQGQWDALREAEFVTGAALAIRKEVLAQVGPFDEGFWPGYFEDADLCLRIRQAGWRILYAPQAVLLHQESTSVRDAARRAYYYQCGRLRLLLKHLEPERWLEEFIAVEQENLPKFVRGQEGFALQLAYSTIMMAAPTLLVDVWRADPETIVQIVDALRTFYRLSIEETNRLHAERLAATTPAWRTVSEAPARPQERLRLPLLSDFTFTSKVRGIGPLVESFRRVWYNVAARWGNQHLRLQQDSINAELAEELALLRQQFDLMLAENARLAATIAQMQQEKT